MDYGPTRRKQIYNGCRELFFKSQRRRETQEYGLKHNEILAQHPPSRTAGTNTRHPRTPHVDRRAVLAASYNPSPASTSARPREYARGCRRSGHGASSSHGRRTPACVHVDVAGRCWRGRVGACPTAHGVCTLSHGTCTIHPRAPYDVPCRLCTVHYPAPAGTAVHARGCRRGASSSYGRGARARAHVNSAGSREPEMTWADAARR